MINQKQSIHELNISMITIHIDIYRYILIKGKIAKNYLIFWLELSIYLH